MLSKFYCDLNPSSVLNSVAPISWQTSPCVSHAQRDLSYEDLALTVLFQLPKKGVYEIPLCLHVFS